MNDTIRELLRAAFTAGENSYLSDDPLTCEDWIETREVHEALESMQEVGLRVVEEHKARGDVLVTLTQRAVALGYDDAADALDCLEAAAAFREPPSREGKVKVVVRGYVDRDGQAYCEGHEATAKEWVTWEELAKEIGPNGEGLMVPFTLAGAARFEAVLYVNRCVVEVVEDVEVVE